jgi:Putative DNA-binding domain
MSRAADHLGPFAAALLDPERPAPPGLVTWNGSDPAARFAVYRNNVALSLVEALADTFPVTRELVGAPFFAAMARAFLVSDPPRSPVLSDYGDAFPAFVAAFAPAAALPYLPDLARLELLRVRAFHAADAEPLEGAAIAAQLAEPDRLPEARLTLVPSLAVLDSPYGIISLWAAHQGQGRIEDLDPARPESALVLRVGEEVLVLPVPPATAAFTAALGQGLPLGEAAALHPDLDLTQAFALLIRHGAIAAWHPPGEPSA